MVLEGVSKEICLQAVSRGSESFQRLSKETGFFFGSKWYFSSFWDFAASTYYFDRSGFSRERLQRVLFKNLLRYSSANHHHLIIISSSSSSSAHHHFIIISSSSSSHHHHHHLTIIIIFPLSLSLSLAFLFFSVSAHPVVTKNAPGATPLNFFGATLCGNPAVEC